MTNKNKRSPKDPIVLTHLEMPIGKLLAGATTQGVCLLEYADTDRIDMQLERLEKGYGVVVKKGKSNFIDMLEQQLNEYFAGKRKDFDVPLDTVGTDFQKQVWDALLTIPYGETRSYQQQAEAINNPKAVRAVANANRNNKISILIPCHRVIGKNGTMTGYGGGIWRKEYLLKLESA